MEIPIDKILDSYTVSAPERVVRQRAVAVIKSVTGIDVPLEAVTYQKGELRVEVAPLTRSQIHIHKKTILNRLAEELKDRHIKDVR